MPFRDSTDPNFPETVSASSRRAHALTYLRIVRPILLTVTLVATVLTWIYQPGLQSPVDVAMVSAGFVVMVAAALAATRMDPVRVALWVQAFDVVIIATVVTFGSAPHDTAAYALLPIIGIAYFGTVRATIVATIVAVLSIQVWANTLDDWVDDKAFSQVAFLVGICGALIAFITSQARRAERLLEVDVARDRVALRLSRGIRMADDPTEAIQEIARTIGSATGALRSIVVLLEHDDDYVADIASWHRTLEDRPIELDVTSVDATLRHLVSTGYGALVDARGARLLAPVDGDEEDDADTPGSPAVEASMRALLDRIGGESGIITALPMGGRSVGAIVLAAEASHDWNSEAIPLLDTIAPQLAAGLAQVVLVRDQRDALESLERLDRMRDRLIANVSHELRTPLTSTIGFIETLLREDLPIGERDRQTMMEHARDGGLRLLALVEDLLALGSTRPESLDLTREPIQVSHLASDAIRGISPPKDRHIALQVDDDPLVTVDRNRMLQVLGNLVVNAVHHGAGDVEVRCHSHDGGALVDVIDDGPGVAPEHVHELFLPFARFSTRSDSTGLGLAICRTIVEAHGGAIDYSRIAGGRTRFRVRIPARSSID